MNNQSFATKNDFKDLKKELKKDIGLAKAGLSELKIGQKSLFRSLWKLEKRIENLEEGVVRIEKKIDRVEERLSEKMDKIMNTLDGFVGMVDDIRTDNTVGTHQARELHLKVEELEKRVEYLESIKRSF